MATLMIRNLDPALHARLKARAAAEGRSMEEEARRLLRDGLAVEPIPLETHWVDAIRALFEPLGGLEIPEIPREPPRDPPDFSGPEWDFDQR
jgi:plasmid stability protein